MLLKVSILLRFPQKNRNNSLLEVVHDVLVGGLDGVVEDASGKLVLVLITWQKNRTHWLRKTRSSSLVGSLGSWKMLLKVKTCVQSNGRLEQLTA